MRVLSRRGPMFVAAMVASVVAVSVIQSASAGPAPTTSGFVPISPCRLLDTRPGTTNVGPRSTPLGAGETMTVQVWGISGNCTVPSSATAVSLNVVSIEPTASSFLTVFPAGAARPNASNLNWTAAQAPTPNAVTSALSADGKLDVFNLAGTVHLAADVVGYWTPTSDFPQGAAGPAGAAGSQGVQGPPGAVPIDPPTIVWVAPSGADFTSISDALDSITDASASRPYLVRLAPGAYAEDAGVFMKDWVSIEGSGPSSVITSTSAGMAPLTIFIDGLTHLAIRDLAIESADATGIYVSSSTGIELSGLTIDMTDGVGSQEAIRVDGSTVTIRDSSISTVDAPSVNWGIRLRSSSTVLVERTSVRVTTTSGAPNCLPVIVDQSAAELVDLDVTADGCGGVQTGVSVLDLAEVTMRRVHVELAKTGFLAAVGIRVSGSTATIDDADVEITTSPSQVVLTDTSTVLVRDSTLIGTGTVNSFYRSSGTARLVGTVLGGDTFGMAGRCTNTVDISMTPYTCV